ncbi:hypothetical protein J3F83DRAFT_117944 [Trichoderma novae-zelandiae]
MIQTASKARVPSQVRVHSSQPSAHPRHLVTWLRRPGVSRALCACRPLSVVSLLYPSSHIYSACRPNEQNDTRRSRKRSPEETKKLEIPCKISLILARPTWRGMSVSPGRQKPGAAVIARPVQSGSVPFRTACCCKLQSARVSMQQWSIVVYVRYLSFSLWQNSVGDGASIGLDSAVVERRAVGPANDAALVTMAPWLVHAVSCQTLCLKAWTWDEKSPCSWG